MFKLSLPGLSEDQIRAISLSPPVNWFADDPVLYSFERGPYAICESTDLASGMVSEGPIGANSVSHPVNWFVDDPVLYSLEPGPSAISESTVLASGWTVFRMLILGEEEIKYEKNDIDKICEDTGAKIGIYPTRVAARLTLTVVMVSAKERPGSSTHPAVSCLREICLYFADRARSPIIGEARLLVPAAQASRLVVDDRFKTIQQETDCSLTIYLTDIVSIFSPGDVIIEVIGKHEGVDNAIELIASDLKSFTVDEGMIFDLEVQRGIPKPYNVVYANECSAGKDECRSSNLDLLVPTSEDPFEYLFRCAKSKSEVLKNMNSENGVPTPVNVVSAIIGDAARNSNFKDLKFLRNIEIEHRKTIPLSVASRILGLNDENISTIQQSCLASITLRSRTSRGMVIRILGGSRYEVEEAKSVMKDFTGLSALDCMWESVGYYYTPGPSWHGGEITW